ncbi:terminase small subunit [Streptococcus phage P9]|uniref:Phage terminase small subunit n=14 Tax=Bacteria TaxID=2 RepID=Q1CQL4_STRPC|nr:terminase small subunit [Streptococcus phage P9]AAZ52059.1 phage terminase small subunit [Streptococcus pyogenes MGAS5005]ABF32630.1 phage terminase small subunit [Streptococcus pyogenes MGAS9429]ABF36519.1 phage terminase small subunit [Streptococcus pyogenes MGAS2096]BAM30838.2 phage terminase small subunit [Streptococcus pyogenes M1 476]ABL61054.1 terminase small subunit [Streptococcus phage P9]
MSLKVRQIVSCLFVMLGGDGKLSKLTLKQKRFADEYIISANATAAAIKAGYSKKTARSIGQENLTKPDIKAYIDERLEKLESEKIATQEEVLQYLTSIMRGDQQEKTLISVGEFGQKIVDIDVGAKDRIKAAELLGKRYRLFTDKVEMDVSSDVTINVGEWDDD